ncbi:MAG: type I-E CRISPR-associated protein Cse1/CasA [Acidobacteria bacterium]|nr:type I-E CRISPR-associated protein Cse1/CasA [Acidobacteriota bacterium]
MNLIEDPWIPVATRSGRRLRIAPWELTKDLEKDPIVMVAAPRPDFSGALLEFLIGLLQTEAAPEERRDWARWRDDPPSPAVLHDRLTPAKPHFELFGDGPRFMQSFDEFEGKSKGIGDLIVDDPPSEMIKKNTDLFIKRDRISGLCPSCAAAALYVANAYSPAAGRGHRTSLRGGGPVTTLVTPDPGSQPERMILWHVVWLNVMSRRDFENSVPGNAALHSLEHTYAWTAPTRTSENGEVTTPEDMSPYHAFWGMPRRIRLHEPGEVGSCDLCLDRAPLVRGFELRHGGMNYDGAWLHPLTPYSFDEAGVPAAFHMPRGGLGYKNWPSIATGQKDRKIRREPALVGRNALRLARGSSARMSILAFGYDVDNAKIRGWYEYRAPAFAQEPDAGAVLKERAGGMVLAAGEVAGNLRTALRAAWKSEKSPEFAISAFWQGTEARFYQRLDELVRVLGEEEAERKVLKTWHDVLCTASEKLFETWAEAGEIGAADPGRIARAHVQLKKNNWKTSIRNALLLPEKQAGKKGEAHD